MSEESRNDGSLRLLFEISRDDNPALYDDLARFSKGQKRVNRLRLLAHEGLRAMMPEMGADTGGGDISSGTAHREAADELRQMHARRIGERMPFATSVTGPDASACTVLRVLRYRE